MRPSSFNSMPHGQNFNQFRGPMPGAGRFMPPPNSFPPGRMPQMPPQGFQQGFQQGIQGPNPAAPQPQSPKLDSFMNTANKWLSTAQSFQPLIQQATPMLQNLPALWKLYKGFQSSPKSTDEAERGYDDFDLDDEQDYEQDYEPEYRPPRPQRKRSERQTDSRQTESRQTESRQSKSRRPKTQAPKSKPISSKPSVPRIFQPPYDFE